MNMQTKLDPAALDEMQCNAQRATDFLKALAHEGRLMILCHLAAGESNKVIARELGISEGTVKLHVKSILRKLQVHSRVQAAVIAVEAGLCQR